MRHRERRRPWETGVEVAAFGMLLIPTSLVLFFAEVVWGDNFWPGAALISSLTFPPTLALWWIERRRQRRKPAASTEPPTTGAMRGA
ncbi:hypothetical protein WEI85_02810 [Actinomycetes bacterium KLBMP 9797]